MLHYTFPTPFRSVELCLLLNCLYMALWATNFIEMVKIIAEDRGWEFYINLAMLFPIVFVFFSMIPIIEISSSLLAISELNLEVIRKPLLLS